jgi:hypothetical protein
MVARLLGLVLAGAIGVGLASCGAGNGGGGGAPARTGAVVGRAVPCSGPMYIPTAQLAVFRDRTLVVSGRFHTGSPFRFTLPPGRYVITNNRADPTFGAPFRIRAGHVARVVVPDACE